MSEKFVDSYLYFKCRITEFLKDGEISFRDEGDLLVRCFGAENIAQRYVLESFRLSDVIVIWLS
jgi:hypothetical protein